MANTNTLSLTFYLVGNGTLTDATQVVNVGYEPFKIGNDTPQFPGDGVQPEIDLSTGTGDGQGNQWYQGQRTLAATTYDLLNLNDATLGLKNGIGQPIQLVKVKVLLIVINGHDGVKNLLIGPQNQTHAWQGWFGGVTANYYDTVYWFHAIGNEDGNGIGTVLDSTHNILAIYNPTASPITYSIFIAGTE